MLKHTTTYILLFIFMATTAFAQSHDQYNYDETKVPDYTLPDILTLSDGRTVKDAQSWRELRRPEILQLFAEHVYGKVPEADIKVDYVVTTNYPEALDGAATLKEVKVTFSKGQASHDMSLLMFIPNDAVQPVPAFLGLNFYGNHTIHPDPHISISDSWARNNEEFNISGNQADEKSRGVRVSRWPVERIIDRGYALINIYYGDIDPDFDDGFENGIHALFHKAGQKPADDEWGSIAAWAWGLSRALDYLETENSIDAAKVAVIGHSRIGKAALWAGATDERFALVISNDSGCGGAAISRRKFGETVARINTSFPHWFADNFNQYNDNESALPVDQHMLLALMAPRPLYVASAAGDLWADPRGEFLSSKHASKVYELLGKEGLPVEEMPVVNRPVMGTIGYHIRTEGHDLKAYDWEQYLDFADKHLKQMAEAGR
ncbi:acetylxylan esterase [Catalinimonas sp. 4WD22]|uniref:alpha/beta hydrolase family protein n=1 Tax=Catalinimonas locisalis TaxID=3133978 RepID=UPI0031012B0E